MISIPNRITQVMPRGAHRLHLRFRDGAEFDLDLLPWVRRETGSPLIDPLRSPKVFQKIKLGHGTLVFPTGYDICPDVLRLWCEKGRPLSNDETDRYFLDAFAMH